MSERSLPLGRSAAHSRALTQDHPVRLTCRGAQAIALAGCVRSTCSAQSLHTVRPSAGKSE